MARADWDVGVLCEGEGDGRAREGGRVVEVDDGEFGKVESEYWVWEGIVGVSLEAWGGFSWVGLGWGIWAE